MIFTESNTVEQMILNAAVRLGDELRPARWTYPPHTDIPRQWGNVMLEPWVREALIRLNLEIAAQPDRADEVIYNLRACILSCRPDGLVRANENFMAWLRGEKPCPSAATVSMCRCTWWTPSSLPTTGSRSPTSGPFRRARWRSA